MLLIALTLLVCLTEDKSCLIYLILSSSTLRHLLLQHVGRPISSQIILCLVDFAEDSARL